MPKLSDPKFGYVAKYSENVPAKNANGERTIKWFKETFDMSPKEGLALMGAHTVGQFSTFAEHTGKSCKSSPILDTQSNLRMMNRLCMGQGQCWWQCWPKQEEPDFQ